MNALDLQAWFAEEQWERDAHKGTRRTHPSALPSPPFLRSRLDPDLESVDLEERLPTLLSSEIPS